MSKVSSKNLSYESNEPTFLRRLRGEHGDAGSARHERPLARPRKQMTDGDDDDHPTYVVEGSLDTLSKKEYEELTRKEQDDGESESWQQKPFEALKDKEGSKNEDKTAFNDRLELKSEQVAVIGGTQKKRNVTAIGADDKGESDQPATKKTLKARKGKKVKLSFDEE